MILEAPLETDRPAARRSKPGRTALQVKIVRGGQRKSDQGVRNTLGTAPWLWQVEGGQKARDRRNRVWPRHRLNQEPCDLRTGAAWSLPLRVPRRSQGGGGLWFGPTKAGPARLRGALMLKR